MHPALSAGVERVLIGLQWGVDLFHGGCSFNIKNKLKSDVFNDKIVYKQKCFSLS